MLRLGAMLLGALCIVWTVFYGPWTITGASTAFLILVSMHDSPAILCIAMTVGFLLVFLHKTRNIRCSCRCRCGLRSRGTLDAVDLAAAEFQPDATLHFPCTYEHPPFPPPPAPVLPKPPPPGKRQRKNSNPRNSGNKKIRVANVRKGCIMGKPTEGTLNKIPGPKPNPDAPTNKKKRTQKKNKALSLKNKLKLEECVWRTSHHGGKRSSNNTYFCCSKKCNHMWATEAGGVKDMAFLISQYRNYYHSLTDSQKALFWDQHTYYDGYKKHLNGEQLKKNGRHYKYVLEPFDLMRAQLQAAAYSKTAFAPMDRGDMGLVCVRMLMFVTGGHNDTSNQHYIRRNFHSHGGTIPPEMMDCGLSNVRSAYTDRPKPKAVSARNWLMSQGKLALLDPTKDVSILPYRTAQSTHAFYIFLHEYEAGKEWVPDALQAWKLADEGCQQEQDHTENDLAHSCDVELGVLQEQSWEDDLDPVEQEEAAAREKALNKKVKYRYGNKSCGVVDASKPEDPELASYSHFCNVWREDEHLRKIICREYLPFAKCNFCIRQRQNAERLRTEDEIKIHHEQLKDHLAEVRREKMAYYSNRARARRTPDNIMSMIIDGADQSKYDLPHFKDRSHLLSEARRLKMHVYGALVHGPKGGAHAFIIPDHEHQGHNTTIQVIHSILVSHLKKHKKLPPILKLQLDNTTKQNKGQYLYGYLNLLVEFGVFEDVEVSFLPVGHTHEDIDQFFSRISVYLKYHARCTKFPYSSCVNVSGDC